MTISNLGLLTIGKSCIFYLFWFILFYLFIFVFFVVVVAISWAAPAAYGGSQARGLIRAAATSIRQSHSNAGSEPRLQPTPQPQQHTIQAACVTYTTAHGNTGSLNPWVRPGIEAATSWFPVGFVSTAPWQELPSFLIIHLNDYNLIFKYIDKQVLF